MLRTVAIIIEVLLLAAVAYAVLNGLRMAALDIGIRGKYNRAVTLALAAVGVVLLAFFIAHLATFYPGGGG